MLLSTVAVDHIGSGRYDRKRDREREELMLVHMVFKSSPKEYRINEI